jgi:hypothetical protein
MTHSPRLVAYFQRKLDVRLRRARKRRRFRLMRTWANAHGFDIAPGGHVPKSVQKAYRKAQH